MKNIFFLIFLFACVFLHAQTPSASVLITGQNSINAGSFSVGYSISANHYNGPMRLIVKFDNTKVSIDTNSITSAGFSPGIPLVSGNSTTYTITGINVSDNQVLTFPITYNTICPNTCFGSAIATVFEASVESGDTPQSIAQVSANSFTVNINMPNDWNTNYYWSNYDCKLNQISYTIYLNSKCHRIENGKLLFSFNIPGANIINAGSRPYTSNSIDLGAISGFNNNVVSFVVQLPCSTTNINVTCSGILQGDNCGSFNSNILTLPVISKYIPAFSTTGSYDVSIANLIITGSPTSINSGMLQSVITNSNSTASANVVATLLPLNDKHISQINISPLGILASPPTIKLYDCSNNLISNNTAYSLSINQQVGKIEVLLNNLPASQSATVKVNYDNGTPRCNPFPANTISYNASLAFTMNGLQNQTYCNCSTGNSGSSISAASASMPVPVYACSATTTPVIPHPGRTCNAPGESMTYCTQFTNLSSIVDVINPVIKIGIPSQVSISLSSVKYMGNPISASIVSGNLVIALPNSIPHNSISQQICFDFTINNTGVSSAGFSFGTVNISGNNSIANVISNTATDVFLYNCTGNVSICGFAKGKIEKEVWDNVSNSWSSTGSGPVGSVTKYRYKIYNTGTLPLTKAILIDRLPHSGDKFVLNNCLPRGSSFVMPPFNSATPAVVSLEYFNDTAAGNTTLSPEFAMDSQVLASTCKSFSTVWSTTLQNTVKMTVTANIPASTTPFIIESGNIAIPQNIKAGIACNSAVATFFFGTNVQTLSSESELACYSVMPPPCDNCPEILKESKFLLDDNVLSSAGDYVIKNGKLVITTLKAVQEIKISIADIKYSLGKKGCNDCKTPAIGRACIWPTSITQTVGPGGSSGYLNYYDTRGYGDLSNASADHCNEEIVWDLGVMLQPGTYEIPFQISLPKPAIDDCCALSIENLNIKASIKDKDCKVCDKILTPTSTDCCANSGWTTEPYYQTPIKIPTDATNMTNKKISNDVLKVLPDLGQSECIGCAKKLVCGNTYTFKQNTKLNLGAGFHCNPNMRNCSAITKITANGPSNAAGVNGVFSNGTASFGKQFIFTIPGTYKIKFEGICGDKTCDVCEVTFIIEKDNCLGSSWVKVPSYETVNFKPNSTQWDTPQVMPSSQIVFDVGVAVNIENFEFKCATGQPTYLLNLYNKSTNNLISTQTIMAGSGPSIYSSPNFDVRAELVTKCGDSTCNTKTIIVRCPKGVKCQNHYNTTSTSNSVTMEIIKK